MCGVISPTKPTVPALTTAIAVSTAQPMKTKLRHASSFMPTLRARSSPAASTLSGRAMTHGESDGENGDERARQRVGCPLQVARQPEHHAAQARRHRRSTAAPSRSRRRRSPARPRSAAAGWCRRCGPAGGRSSPRGSRRLRPIPARSTPRRPRSWRAERRPPRPRTRRARRDRRADCGTGPAAATPASASRLPTPNAARVRGSRTASATPRATLSPEPNRACSTRGGDSSDAADEQRGDEDRGRQQQQRGEALQAPPRATWRCTDIDFKSQPSG